MIKSEQRCAHSIPESKPAGSPASQAFCAAKPWRRGDSLAPSKCNHRRAKHPAGVWSPKKDTTYGRVFFWWTSSDSNRRPPQCECDALPAALLAHSSAYWRNRFIIAQLPPLCNAKNCTNLAVLCPNRIARTAPRAFGGDRSWRCWLISQRGSGDTHTLRLSSLRKAQSGETHC